MCLRGGGTEAPALRGPLDEALALEVEECLAEAVVVDAEGGSEGDAGEGLGRVGEEAAYGVGEGRLGERRARGLVVADAQVSALVIVGHELDGEGVGRGGRFDARG